MPSLGHLASLSILLAAVAGADEPGPWEKIRDEAGIVVQRRPVATSPLHEFQGRGVVEAPVARILAIIADSDHRPEWMSQCTTSHITEAPSLTSQISVNRTGAPWPVSDRDVVTVGDTSIDLARGVALVDFHAIEDAREPPVRGVVRIHFLKGHWLLKPIHGGQWTVVEYQVHADPGGSLPNWLINLVSKKLPFETLRKLREQVKKRAYPELEKRIESTPEYCALLKQAESAP